MRATRAPFLSAAAACVLSHCASKPEQEWPLQYQTTSWVTRGNHVTTLDEVPQSDVMNGKVSLRPCNAMVLGSKDGSTYVAVVFKGWVESGRPTDKLKMFDGENFAGKLGFGRATLHDIGNGYDVNVIGIYPADTLQAATSRTDAACSGD